jgi:hypothetical protein
MTPLIFMKEHSQGRKIWLCLVPFVLLLLITGCSAGTGAPPVGSGGSGSSGSGGAGGSGNSVKVGQSGTIVLPNGSSGVAVVHIEDSSGNPLSSPQLKNIAAAFPVTLVAEPPDFSQGLIGGGTMVQEIDAATTTPSLAGTVQVYTSGSLTALAIDADSSFSFLQMTAFDTFDLLCFTGGLHQTTDANGNVDLTSILGSQQFNSFVASADGTLGAEMGSAGLEVWTFAAETSPHEIIPSGPYWIPPNPTSAIQGRGAMAINPNTNGQVLVGAGDQLYVYSGFKSNFPSADEYGTSVIIPNGATISSVAYLPGGNYAVIATSAGLYTATIGDTGSAITVTLSSSAANPTFVGSDGNTYAVDHAQSIAITQDGKYLVALTDQPSETSGTLVILPVSSAGVVGSVGATVPNLLATEGVDSVFAY